jgi:hypothetical protein
LKQKIKPIKPPKKMVQRFTQYIYLFILSIVLSTTPTFAYASKGSKDDNKPVAGKTPAIKVAPMISYQTSFAANRHLVSPESNAEAAIITEEALAEKEKAKGVFEELDRANRYIDDIVDKDLQVLPIGFKKTVGNGKVEVAVSRAEFYSQYAELTMYVRMTIPGEDGKEKILFLGADKVRFTAAGGISSFKAVLLGDFPLIESEDGYSVILKGAGGIGTGGEILDPNQTYAQVDCGQFKEAQIIAQVLIPRKTIIPLTDGTFLPIENARVTCDFKARIVGSLDNLVGSLTFRTPFSAPSADGFAFKVVNASFDISNAENPTSMGFPVGYVGDKTAAWQGVFIQNFTVYLPKQFKKKGSTARTSLSALNVLIDRTGFSGIVEANTPIFSINEGSASGWAMSLDRLKVSLVQNKLTEGSFAGSVAVSPDQPLCESNTII